MAKRIYNCDAGYSSASPSSYASMSSPSSVQDVTYEMQDLSPGVPFQDLQTLQLSNVVGSFNSELMSTGSGHENYQIVQSNPRQKSVHLVILEEPVSKFRYRYESEMSGTHGCLLGRNSSKMNKTHPTVELKGFHRKALIRCVLYQVDKEVPHSHRLVVRRGDQNIDDPHELELNQDRGYRAVFQGMGIIHTAKRDIAKLLFDKKKKYAEFENGSRLTEKEKIRLKKECEDEAKNMNLNQVVLRFEAYEVIDNKLIQLCDPIYSKPISNMKCALTGELKITRLSSIVSSAAGNDDLFLFVEKVGKKNIRVRFFELDGDEEVWSAYGKFSENDVHHQYAIALTTPPYKDPDIETYAHCYIQLERPSDLDRSEPIEFKFKPRDCVSARKRPRTCSSGRGSFEITSSIKLEPTGQTISEEYNKELIVANLTNFEAEFEENVFKNSDELSRWVNNDDDGISDIMELLGDESGGLETDCNVVDLRTEINKRKISQKNPDFTREVVKKISKWIWTANMNGTSMESIRNNILKVLTGFNEKSEDLLHRIIRKREVKEGIELLKKIHELKLYEVIHFVNDNGDNCLHIAAYNDADIFVQPLLSIGADPNVLNKKGKTPLHIAVENDSDKCVAYLVDKSYYSEDGIPLEINTTNDNGETALHIAVKNKNLKIVKMLIEKGNASTKICCGKTGNNVLHVAVETQCPELVEYLVNNTEVKIYNKNSSGFTPLMIAQSLTGEAGKKIFNILTPKTDTNQFKDIKIKTEPQSYSDASDDDNSIKSLKIVDYISETDESNYSKKSMKSEFDDVLINDLCKVLQKNGKWKELAELLNLHEHLNLWRSPKAMLIYLSEAEDITIDTIIEKLRTLNLVEAMKLFEI